MIEQKVKDLEKNLALAEASIEAAYKMREELTSLRAKLELAEKVVEAARYYSRRVGHSNCNKEISLSEKCSCGGIQFEIHLDAYDALQGGGE